MPKQCSRLSIMCLPILFLIWSSAAANSAASSNSCRFHITVSGAGTDSLNGVYYDETAELSDSVVYYYKWSAELKDWILLFRAADEDTGKRRRNNVAVIIVRIVFIGPFLFYCLLCNYSFPTNPNSVTNCSKLFSLLQLYNYIAPASLF